MSTKLIQNVAKCSYSYVDGSDIVTDYIVSNTVTTNINMADILIYKSSPSKYLGKDEEISYTITVINNTDIDAKQVLITDNLETGCTYLKNSMNILINKINAIENTHFINQSTENNIIITLPILSGRSVATITFKVLPSSSVVPGSVINNMANVFYNSTTIPSNSIQTTYNYAIVEVKKLVDKKGKENISCEDNMDYQIVLQNKGNVSVSNLTISDRLDDMFQIYPVTLSENIKVNGNLIDGNIISATIVDDILYINGISMNAKNNDIIPTTTITIQGKIIC